MQFHYEKYFFMGYNSIAYVLSFDSVIMDHVISTAYLQLVPNILAFISCVRFISCIHLLCLFLRPLIDSLQFRFYLETVDYLNFFLKIFTLFDIFTGNPHFIHFNIFQEPSSFCFPIRKVCVNSVTYVLIYI